MHRHAFLPLALLLSLAACDSATGSSQPPEVLYTSCHFSDCSLRAIRSDGTGDRLVLADGWDGEWSPNGRQIVFVTDRDENDEIYVVDADGTDARRLTSTAGNERAPTWAPNGSSIAFVTPQQELVRMDLDGSHRQVLMPTAFCDLWDPVWSPDGSRLVAADCALLMSVPASGGAVQNIAEGEFPAWTPSGDRLTFSDDSDLQTMLPNGGDAHSLGIVRGEREHDYYPAWSRRGDRIAFMRYASATSGDIYTAAADGSDVRLLVGGAGMQYAPSWGR
jgi:TolB protein